MNMHAVGDYSRAHPLVNEYRPHSSRCAMLEWTHCVIKVSGFRETRIYGVQDLLVCSVGMTDARHCPILA